MSFFPSKDPVPGDVYSCDAIERVIVPRTSDIGGFEIRRALPSAGRRMVGPFIFLDHMGPAIFQYGRGVDVRPHPHIGLATVTYLFGGEIIHRDSLGTLAAIKPGEVNWMTAGRGIAHSERTGSERRASGGDLHGLQCWVALPQASEETEPAFAHYDSNALPVVADEGKSVRVVAGRMFGARSPVVTSWDTIFANVMLEPGASFPLDPDYEERAIYVLNGKLDIAGDLFEADRLLIFKAGDRITINALTPVHFVVLGGAAMDGPRHIWWNFVSSRKDRIEQAKADWKSGRFALVPGDETEFIPLPDR